MLPRTNPKNPSLPFIAAMILLGPSSIGASAAASDLDPQIVKLVGSVSEERLGALLQRLESFETRSTLSSTDSPTRGIGAAREWIRKEMQSYSPKLQVSFDSYNVLKQGRITRDVEVRNVMAVLPGKGPRRIYISGHYDTVAFAGGQGNSNAGGTPGARATTPDPWREAWGPDWQHDVLVGNVTGLILPNLQIDDYVFGVAAIDSSGHESSVTAWVSPARAEMNVKTAGQ